jgi:hypothetical protein
MIVPSVHGCKYGKGVVAAIPERGEGFDWCELGADGACFVVLAVAISPFGRGVTESARLFCGCVG